MKLNIDGDKLFLKNDYAGCMWIFYTFLLLPFIPAIYLLWQEPRDSAPLYFVLPFTLMFIISAPLIIREAVKMKIVTLEINRTIEEVKITKGALYKKSHKTYTLSEIKKIEVECSDNDGEFFNVNMLFDDGNRLPILHGSYRAGVFNQIDEINQFIKIRSAEIPVEEIKV